MTQHELFQLISKKELKKDKIEKIASVPAILGLLTIVSYFVIGAEENAKTYAIIFFIFGGVALMLLIFHSSVLGSEINKLKIEYILNHFGHSSELETKLKGLLSRQLDAYYSKSCELEKKQISSI